MGSNTVIDTMDMDQKEEIYEIARQAVRDELYSIISVTILTTIGIIFVLYGLLIFTTAPLSHSVLSPTRSLGIGFGILGLSIIGILWRWDQAVYHYLPIKS